MNKLGPSLDHNLLAHIQGALDFSPACIVIAAAPSGEIIYFNEAVRKFRCDTSNEPLTGTQIEQYAKTWKAFSPDGSPLSGEELPLRMAIKQGKTVKDQEVIVELDDGSRRWALASAAPVLDREGNITAASVIWYDITERKALEQKLKREADFDCLTGVFSRHRVMEAAHRILERCQRDGTPMSLLLFDLDSFKCVNDQYGHLAGDEVLRSFAGVIKRSVRPSDVFGRIGGEEFLLILQGANLDIGGRVGEKLRREVERSSIVTDNGDIGVTVSIGLTSVDHYQQAMTRFPTVDDLLAQADKALYRAKHNGRNQVEVY